MHHPVIILIDCIQLEERICIWERERPVIKAIELGICAVDGPRLERCLDVDFLWVVGGAEKAMLAYQIIS